jgi:hypothetical protein
MREFTQRVFSEFLQSKSYSDHFCERTSRGWPDRHRPICWTCGEGQSKIHGRQRNWSNLFQSKRSLDTVRRKKLGMSTPAQHAIHPKNGTGDWKNFRIPLEKIFGAAAEWKTLVSGVEKPWLCWNVSSRWNQLQQRLVKHVGWTPVVGFDPRSGPPHVEPGSILIDFNANFGLPLMYPHFPLEFMFLWAERLAFWHADLLCRLPVMEELARRFEALENGQTTAVLDKGGRRNYLNFKRHRFWELCGCTTRAASENQFYNGCGWWRNYSIHPKCTLPEERRRRQVLYYDHGAGIMYWKTRYHGPVLPISLDFVKEGHCSEVMNLITYQQASNHTTDLRNLTIELDVNYSIDEVAARLGITQLLG